MTRSTRSQDRARHGARALLLIAVLTTIAATACNSRDADVRWRGADPSAAGIAAVPQPSQGRTVATTLLDASDQFLRRADTTIRYRDIGSGEPVVMLHGYSDRGEMWRKAADSLARDYRVIVPDIRGFGLSSRFRDARLYGKPMMLDVLALLDSLQIPNAHVIGYSMGGLIGAQLALHAPERVRSASFVAAAVFPDSAHLARLLAPHIDALSSGKGLVPFMKWILPNWPDDQLREVSAQIYAVNDSAALVESLRAMPGFAVDWRTVERTQVPAMVIVGRADPLLRYSRDLASRWPGATLRELDGNDHAVIADAPELVGEFRKLASRVDAGKRIAMKR